MFDLTLALPGSQARQKTKGWAVRTHINYVLLGLTITLTLTYLVVVSSLSSKTYEIKKLQQDLDLAQQEQRQLQLESSGLQSIDRIQSAAQDMGFVPATGVTYLKNSNFALK